MTSAAKRPRRRRQRPARRPGADRSPSSKRLAATWATRPGFDRLAVERRSQGHRPPLHRHRAGLPGAGRRAGDRHAPAAVEARQRSDRRRALQRDLHHARHDDDVPVRRAGDAGHADLPDAADGRHAGDGLPAADAFSYWMYLAGGCLLWVAFILNIGPDIGWFAYPPLSGPAIWRSASAPTSGRRW
jgi:hypothetical protein